MSEIGALARLLAWVLGLSPLWVLALPRAASLTPCADQYLLGLADPAQIVAVSSNATDPRQSLFAAEASRFSSTRGSGEELVALRVELVLTDRWMPLRVTERLGRFGIRVVQIPLPDTWDDIAATTRAIAAELGRPAQGEARVAEMRARLAKLTARHPSTAAPPLAAYFLPDGSSAGRGTFIDAVLEAAGTRNLATTLGRNGWGTFNLEQLASTAPELIVTGFFDQGGDSARMAFARHPVFQRLLARVPAISVPDRYWICSGWFLAEAAEYIADRLPAAEARP
ncbi:MAG: ABC transporter substrate-binding protein [Candidatus Competibacteraceae bacterium]|nr:ABC transporter substrate-binding protein [Candidatus Competibacteraceae bacterium]MBK7984589.1 ABC transporter substrate-binding protein [Candidatus Competibacteraceae bacterium]MBK8897158.1 ABC transporter substrate-binding protein [Candidatus Competibacteraceae bacterium]MBK8964641.1 ABC transporter substrate-binding protein [Candidatus Competibacteraceae bacterium]MBK9952639.1 ABC transporter substrate-binding protein [Candidatus Competibacteraceae bacterium]